MSSRKGPAELDWASELVLAITLPIERTVTFPIREGRKLWRDYISLVDVRNDNSRLRESVSLLREENLQYREAIVSSERFQRLADFRAQREVPMVPANVVAQDLSAWFQSVMIDQGSTSGIRPGMPVITDEGVVGVVDGTTPSASKVLLIADPKSWLDTYVQRTRARGTVHGRSGRLCDFDYVLREEDVVVGDLLLTSGLGAVYPKGLIVGRVAEVEKKPYGLFQTARVEPTVDFRQLEEVFVILEQRKLPAAADFTVNDPGLWPEIPAE